MGSWGGSLNLFVWMVVGGYLIWGCRPRTGCSGLAVMPPAVALLALAWARAGARGPDTSDSAFVLVFHVGLVLAALAAFSSRPAWRPSTSGRNGG